MSEQLSLFATAPKGMEPLLADELSALGAHEARPTRAGVGFLGSLELAYRACLWSRIANRILLTLSRFPAATPEELYAGVQGIRWDEQLAPDASLAVDFTSVRSQIDHTHFGALKVKDAIVDQFRDRYGERPSVELHRPAIRVHLHLSRDRAQLALDLSGSSLHQRGYREDGGAAPLKENLAAAILLRAGWPEVAATGGPLLDPMCGSGTLTIEAALMAADIAPGLLRDYFGFLGWKRHRPEIWERLLTEARQRQTKGLEQLPAIVGYDQDRGAVRAALANVERAGLSRRVHIEKRDIDEVEPVGTGQGLVVVNPPYGERLGEEKELTGLYRRLGETLKRRFVGWQAAVFTGNPKLGHAIGLRSHKHYTLYNGAIECKLLRFSVIPERFARSHIPGANPWTPKPLTGSPTPTHGMGMLANRLRKNLKNVGRWARRNGVDCYRLYDADLPEYALAIDIYQGDRLWVHAQEYEAPKSVEQSKARIRLREALTVMPQVLEIPVQQLFLKQRRRQRGSAQYERLAESGEFHEVQEGNCRFLVNFTDYLDTGLFLDQRITRGMLQPLANGRRFLNLFAYTGSATVYAARGGARETVTVDMSATYLAWARRNMALNGFSGKPHHYIQSDCLQWLVEQQGRDRPERFGLIFLDPPTFSNSKRMQNSFDVQRDHVELLNRAAALLEPDGVLIFSTNNRRFKLDREALGWLNIEDISRSTIPEDFKRNPRIHYCWRIRKTD